MSEETVQRFLHLQGYRYYQSRKKGRLTPEDLKHRLKYATEISKRPESKELWFLEFPFALTKLVSSTSIILLMKQSQSKHWLGENVMKVLKGIVQIWSRKLGQIWSRKSQLSL